MLLPAKTDLQICSATAGVLMETEADCGQIALLCLDDARL
jgi:hypothetical protein